MMNTKDLPAISRQPIPRGLRARGTTNQPPTALWLVHEGEEWRALSNQPPHPKGCGVEWVPAEELFVEPCLGEVFDKSGLNVAGPAPRGMDEFPVVVRGVGLIEVDLSKPTPVKR